MRNYFLLGCQFGFGFCCALSIIGIVKECVKRYFNRDNGDDDEDGSYSSDFTDL